MGSHSVEDIKRASRGLRGTLRESLANPVTGALAESDQTLIKYHGSYQQDDRDLREERRLQMLEPAHAFMIRTRTPGGIVTPAQWLKLDRIATTHAERGLRITTRQAFQFHGVIKQALKPTLRAINSALMDTLAACGDVNRNVTVSASPLAPRAHRAMVADAAALSAHLLPNTRAYYELWLDEEKVADSGSEDEPIYGATYLPRKFKIGFALPPYNDVDVYAQDLGFIAVVRDGVLQGYNVCIGGGMGASHGDAQTYPRVADLIGFISPGQVIAVGEAVVTTQRDWGNREVRKRARFKYTIDDHGLERVRAEIERRAGFALAPAQPFTFDHNGDRFGWSQAPDGRWNLGLRIVSGRIWDRDGSRALTGLRQIAQQLDETGGEAELRLTANQNLVIANLDEHQRSLVEHRVAEYGLDRHTRDAPARLNAIACVALPTCGLAMAEAERYLPDFLDRFMALLRSHGLQDQPINLRISGCPNGCSRPYLGEIALVGKAPGRYNLMLGGDHRGQRLNALYRENIDEAGILAALDPLLEHYARERNGHEDFGDFLVRAGCVEARGIDIEVLP